MEMSIATLAEASEQLGSILVDSIAIYDLGETVTTSIHVARDEALVASPISALVQTTTLQNAVESIVVNTYSVKVPRGTTIEAGQLVKVLSCMQEPELVGKRLMLDKVSQNGLALLRKCVASDYHQVDQQGKAGA